MRVRVNKDYRRHAGEVGEIIGYCDHSVRVAFNEKDHLDVWSYDPEDLTPVDDEPTKEQLVKAFKLFYSDKVVFEDVVDRDSDFDDIAGQILSHWNDDEA